MSPEMEHQLRTVHVPADRRNPYQRALGLGLSRLGVRVKRLRLGWNVLATAKGADVLHIHWTSAVVNNPLWKVAAGTYVVRASKVPMDESHTLNIRAVYNDTIVRDGIVQRMGQTVSGTLTLQIPHGRDLYSFGDQLLDLR